MNTVIKAVNLNIDKENDSLPILKVGRGSNHIQLAVTLFANGVIYSISGDVSARVHIRKPDKTEVYNDCTINGNVIIVPLTTQSTAVEGEAVLKLQLLDGTQNTVLYTPACFMVVKAGINDAEIVSSNEFGALEDALVKTQEGLNEIDKVKYPAWNAVVNCLPQWEESNFSLNGITCTKNADGSIYIAGNATGEFWLRIYGTDTWEGNLQVDESYLLHGCPPNGSTETFCLWVNKISQEGTRKIWGQETGNGLILDKDYRYDIRIYVAKGTNVDETFYPMLEKGTARHSYVPYSGYENLSEVGCDLKSIINTTGTSPINATGETTITGAIEDLYQYTQLNYTTLKTDALWIDTKNKYGEANKPHYVVAGSTTVNFPSDCSAGIWKCAWINTSCIFVEIVGVDTSNRPATWMNRYNAATWTGWYRGINSGNITSQSVTHATSADTATTATTATSATRAASAAAVDTVSGFSKLANVAKSTSQSYLLSFNGGSDQVGCVPYNLQTVGKATSADNGRTYNGGYGPAVASLNGHVIGLVWDTNVNRVGIYVDSTFIQYI